MITQGVSNVCERSSYLIFLWQVCSYKKNSQVIPYNVIFPLLLRGNASTSRSRLDGPRVADERMARLGGPQGEERVHEEVSISKIMIYNPIFLNAPRGNEIREPLTKLKIHRFFECISLDILTDCQKQAGYNISYGLESESKSISLRSCRTPQCCPLLREGHSLFWEIVTHS